MAFDPKEPDRKAERWQKHAEERLVVRDAAGGTALLRRKSGIYLPMPDRMNPQAWARRVNQAVAFNTTERARDVLVGLVDRHEPTFNAEVPKWAQTAAIEASGKNMARFTTRATNAICEDGMAVLWSHPWWQLIPVDRVLELTEERGIVTEIRISVDRDTVWRAVLAEPEQAEIQTYTRDADKGSWSMTSELTDIPGPGLPVSHQSIRPMDSPEPPKPPLSNLAYENIRHFQLRFARDGHVKTASVPIAIMKSSEIKQPTIYQIGDGHGIRIGKDDDFFYAEISGSALEASRQTLLDSEKTMAHMSIALIDRHIRGAESSDSRRIDERQASASVRTIARTAQAMLGSATVLAAAWSRGTVAAESLPKVSVALATSQASEPPTTEQLRLLAELVEAGRLPPEHLFNAMERGELIAQGSTQQLLESVQKSPPTE